MNKESYFSSLAHTYNEQSHPSLFKLVRRYETNAVLDCIKGVKFKKVLDLGAGAGHYTRLLAKMADEVHANDLSNEMLKQIEIPTKRKYFGDMAEIDIKDSFDLITVLGSLEFVNDPEVVLRKISSWLNPNGHVLLLAPTLSLLSSIYQYYYKRKSIKIRLYSKNALLKHMKSAGFQITHIRRVFPYNHLILAKKIDNG